MPKDFHNMDYYSLHLALSLDSDRQGAVTRVTSHSHLPNVFTPHAGLELFNPPKIFAPGIRWYPIISVACCSHDVVQPRHLQVR